MTVHEFALAHSVLQIALETAEVHEALRVRTVRCRIGAMRQVVPSLLQTAFEACCRDTVAQGANLMIEVDPITITCSTCGTIRNVETMTYQCPVCDSTDIRMEKGTGMEITSITIDQEDADGHSSPAKPTRA